MKSKKFWKRILIVLILVPTLIVGGLVQYIRSNQSEIIKGEIEKLNKEYKGLVQIEESEFTLW